MEFIFKIIKFCLVGSSGLVVDFGITYILKERIKTHRYSANAAGFTIASFNNFFWNKLWTFQDPSTAIGSQMISFFAIALLGLLINTAFLAFFERRCHLPFYLSKGLAIGIVVIWNFMMNYYFTFRDEL